MKQIVTSVLIVYRKNRTNHALRFGTPFANIRLGWRRSAAVFMPEQVFGYTRWSGNEYGTQDWQLFICKAKSIDKLTRIPGIMPGADLLLHTKGTVRTKRALAALHELETHYGHLGKVSDAYWRNLHNRLQIGWQPRAFSNAFHAK